MGQNVPIKTVREPYPARVFACNSSIRLGVFGSKVIKLMVYHSVTDYVLGIGKD
jgi:hypothetical protein